MPKFLLPYLLLLAIAGALALLLTPTAARAQTAALGNPADLTATPGPGIGEVTLAWTPAANAALHLVAWLPRNGADYQWRLVGAGSATFTDLEAGREYWFTVVSISTGYDRSCGVQTGRHVVCWGHNGSGQAAPP